MGHCTGPVRAADGVNSFCWILCEHSGAIFNQKTTHTQPEAVKNVGSRQPAKNKMPTSLNQRKYKSTNIVPKLNTER